MGAAVIIRAEEAVWENPPARAKPALTATELLARRKAVDFARANVELEGFKVDPEDRALAERFVAGEFDLDEYLAMQGLQPSVYRI
jgi:hypothetical protein